MISLLFIVSKRGYYSIDYPWVQNSGLYNSCKFVVDMLNAAGVPAALEQAVDQNSIDRLVTLHRPTDVIIEAFWVQPAKFAQLIRLHPAVRWYVRGHSNVPFLAAEGSALALLRGYLGFPQVSIGSNSKQSVSDLTLITRGWQPYARPILFMPNYYPLDAAPLPPRPAPSSVLNVGCFGALRILKNQLYQAVAALDMARSLGKDLRFHINVSRKEMLGENVLKSLRNLFAGMAGAALVEHPWLDRPEFLALCARMDLGMQVSYTETFNIVTADMVGLGVPVVVSDEVSWVDRMFRADPNSRQDMVAKSLLALIWPDRQVNRRKLSEYNARSQMAWLLIFGG